MKSAAEHYKGILLVLDDVQDSNAIRYFHFHCATLITSRFRDIGYSIYESRNLFELEVC